MKCRYGSISVLLILFLLFPGAARSQEVITTIHLDNVPDVVCGEVWVQDGVNMYFTQTVQEDCDGGGNCSFGIGSGAEGVWLYPARLVADLGQTYAITKIEVDVNDYCGIGCTKAGKGVFRVLREVRVDNPDDFQVGDQLTADLFATGDLVMVTAKSKGKGFAGPMKRWGFHGAGASHGVHKVHRSAGSVGTSAWPSRVWKGKKMAGQMGNQMVTMKNLTIVGVRQEQGIVLIKGGIPGSKNSVVFIRKV